MAGIHPWDLTRKVQKTVDMYHICVLPFIGLRRRIIPRPLWAVEHVKAGVKNEVEQVHDRVVQKTSLNTSSQTCWSRSSDVKEELI